MMDEKDDDNQESEDYKIQEENDDGCGDYIKAFWLEWD